GILPTSVGPVAPVSEGRGWSTGRARRRRIRPGRGNSNSLYVSSSPLQRLSNLACRKKSICLSGAGTDKDEIGHGQRQEAKKSAATSLLRNRGTSHWWAPRGSNPRPAD